MFNALILATKITCIAALTALVLGALSLFPEPYNRYGIGVGLFFLASHALEYVVVKARFSSVLNTPLSFMQTLVFGFSYWLPLLKQSKQQG